MNGQMAKATSGNDENNEFEHASNLLISSAI